VIDHYTENITSLHIVSVILVIEIGIRGVVTETFVTACALIAVAVLRLEVDAGTANHHDFL